MYYLTPQPLAFDALYFYILNLINSRMATIAKDSFQSCSISALHNAYKMIRWVVYLHQKVIFCIILVTIIIVDESSVVHVCNPLLYIFYKPNIQGIVII